MTLVILPLAVVDAPVFFAQNAIPIALALSIASLESGTVWPLVKRFAFKPVLVKRSLIEPPFAECHLALALLEALVELAFICVARRVQQSAFALHFALHPVADEPSTILLKVLAPAMFKVLAPRATVESAAALPGHDTLAIHLPIEPLAEEEGLIGSE